MLNISDFVYFRKIINVPVTFRLGCTSYAQGNKLKNDH